MTLDFELIIGGVCCFAESEDESALVCPENKSVLAAGSLASRRCCSDIGQSFFFSDLAPSSPLSPSDPAACTGQQPDSELLFGNAKSLETWKSEA
eukprot:2145863-Rhodomonas_salina.7